MALLCQEGCSQRHRWLVCRTLQFCGTSLLCKVEHPSITACACQTCTTQTGVTHTSRRMCCGPWPARPVRAAKGRIPGADAQRAAAAPAEWASCARGMQPRLRRRPMAAALPAAASRGPPRGWAAALTEPGSCSCQSTQSIQSHFDLPCSYDVR